MRPILTVEFSAKSGDLEFKEESVPIHSPDELFDFVAPGGGCEKIPDEVDEIQMIFLPSEHPNTKNTLADIPVTLVIGLVFFTGPLSAISQTAEQLIDKAGRGELADAFLKVIGANS